MYEFPADLYDHHYGDDEHQRSAAGPPRGGRLARTEAVFLERYGRPAAVLVSPEQYEKLVAALEDAEDAAAFDAAMNEEGPNIPWEQVKVDLGWT